MRRTSSRSSSYTETRPTLVITAYIGGELQTRCLSVCTEPPYRCTNVNTRRAQEIITYRSIGLLMMRTGQSAARWWRLVATNRLSRWPMAAQLLLHRVTLVSRHAAWTTPPHILHIHTSHPAHSRCRCRQDGNQSRTITHLVQGL